MTYDAASTLALSPSVYVDIAGSAAARSAVHQRLGESLRHSAIVGATHVEPMAGGDRLPGPEPTLFFAPSVAKARIEALGPAQFAEEMGAAWRGFLGRLDSAEPPWLRVERSDGLDAVVATYRSLIAGDVPADVGHVLSV